MYQHVNVAVTTYSRKNINFITHFPKTTMRIYLQQFYEIVSLIMKMMILEDVTIIKIFKVCFLNMNIISLQKNITIRMYSQ